MRGRLRSRSVDLIKREPEAVLLRLGHRVLEARRVAEELVPFQRDLVLIRPAVAWPTDYELAST